MIFNFIGLKKNFFELSIHPLWLFFYLVICDYISHLWFKDSINHPEALLASHLDEGLLLLVCGAGFLHGRSQREWAVCWDSLKCETQRLLHLITVSFSPPLGGNLEFYFSCFSRESNILILIGMNWWIY